MGAQGRPTRLPNFLIIGAQKAATTTLWAALRSHPQVYCPPAKEPKFFVEEEGWPRGRQWYAELFADATDEIAVGEASTTYTWHPLYAGVPERVLSILPTARFVYVLRDPVERMRSAYAHSLSTGYERQPIDQALLTNARYLYPSLYALQIEQYLRHVDRDRLLLVSSDGFRADPDGTTRRVLSFLECDPTLPLSPPGRDLNVSEGKRAPRLPWRAGRDAAHRMRVATVLPDRFADYRTGRHPLATRPIKESETQLTPDLRERLASVVRPDVQRLRDLAAGQLDEAELARWER